MIPFKSKEGELNLISVFANEDQKLELKKYKLNYPNSSGDLFEFKESNIQKNVQVLNNAGFTYSVDNVVYINNYTLVRPIIITSLKREVEVFLAKTILAKLGKVRDDTNLLLLMSNLEMHREEYMLLWKNSQIAISTGDYDAYLKNCLGYLSLLDIVSENVPPEEVENNKKDIYQNILMCLYA